MLNVLFRKMKGFNPKIFIGFLFVFFSVIFIIRLVNKELPLVNLIPMNVLYWVCAVGALLFGFMIMCKKPPVKTGGF